VTNPSRLVASRGIVMGPMQRAALVVPFVFSLEFDRIAHSKGLHSRSKIDVVCYQKGLTGRESHDEPLMPAAVVVVRQNSQDVTRAFCNEVAPMLLKRRLEDLIIRLKRGCGVLDDALGASAANAEDCSKNQKSGDREILLPEAPVLIADLRQAFPQFNKGGDLQTLDPLTG
jgi:hypothetical protein